MDNVSGHIAADSTVVFRGKTYVVSQPTIRDCVALVNWLKDREIEKAKRQIAGLDLELAKFILKDAMDNARKIELNTPEFQEAAMSIEATAFMLWMMVRRNHSEVTYDVALDLISEDPASALSKLSGVLTKAFGGGNPTNSPTTQTATTAGSDGTTAAVTA